MQIQFAQENYQASCQFCLSFGSEPDESANNGKCT